MKHLLFFLIILFPTIALCCTPPQTAEGMVHDAEIIGKVVKISPLPSGKSRSSLATILVISSAKGQIAINKEYNFMVGGPIGCGSMCLACLTEGSTYQMSFNFISETQEAIGPGASIARLYFYNVKPYENNNQ